MRGPSVAGEGQSSLSSDRRHSRNSNHTPPLEMNNNVHLTSSRPSHHTGGGGPVVLQRMKNHPPGSGPAAPHMEEEAEGEPQNVATGRPGDTTHTGGGEQQRDDGEEDGAAPLGGGEGAGVASGGEGSASLASFHSSCLVSPRRGDNLSPLAPPHHHSTTLQHPHTPVASASGGATTNVCLVPFVGNVPHETNDMTDNDNNTLNFPQTASGAVASPIAPLFVHSQPPQQHTPLSADYHHHPNEYLSALPQQPQQTSAR